MSRVRYKENGQVLVVIAICMVGFVIFAGLAIDAYNWSREEIRARNALDTACVHAVNVVWSGGNGQVAFQDSLIKNGFSATAFSPNEGTGAGLTRGYQWDSNMTSPSIRTALHYDIPTYFIQIVGWNSLPVMAKERCTTTGALITPISVKTSAFYDSLNNGTHIPVVGQGSQAEVDPGKSYRGVVFPFLWCVNSATDFTPNSNCPYTAYFWPLTDPPPSPQTAKNALIQCWYGRCNRVWAPVGMRVPVVAGVSDSQLCKSATDAGLVLGVDFVAIIYDGTVIKPDPSYGPWENVGVLGWGTFTVVELKPNPKNCNSLIAIATGGIYSSPYQIPNPLFPREVPWDALGGW